MEWHHPDLCLRDLIGGHTDNGREGMGYGLLTVRSANGRKDEGGGASSETG